MYPITYNFKRIALANKVTARNSKGEVILYAHQKMLKLREKILIYSDAEKTDSVGELNADKIIDFSPEQTFTDKNGTVVLKVKRNGRRSIWHADYEIKDAEGRVCFRVKEKDAWVKVMNAVLTDIPILGIFGGYFFNPKYNIFDENNVVVGEISKEPAFFESNYTLNVENPAINNVNLLPVATMTVITRERMRG
jgi:uncharacterized protein YxjI